MRRRIAGQFSPLNLTIAALLLFAAAGGFLWRSRQITPRQLAMQRPAGSTAFVYDYAGLLRSAGDDLNRSLQALGERYAIETVVVTLDEMPDELTIAALAQKLLENWQIGESRAGRGILLLVASEDRQIHLAVTAELAHAFTDRFRRHIQNWPWQPLHREGRVSEGLRDALAKIKNRAQLMRGPGCTPADIQRDDRQLTFGLTNGAGVEPPPE